MNRDEPSWWVFLCFCLQEVRRFAFLLVEFLTGCLLVFFLLTTPPYCVVNPCGEVVSSVRSPFASSWFVVGPLRLRSNIVGGCVAMTAALCVSVMREQKKVRTVRRHKRGGSKGRTSSWLQFVKVHHSVRTKNLANSWLQFVSVLLGRELERPSVSLE